MLSVLGPHLKSKKLFTLYISNLFTVTSSNFMDIHRIVPSLCPKSVDQYPLQLSCPVCHFQADSEMALDSHMKEHRYLSITSSNFLY